MGKWGLVMTEPAMVVSASYPKSGSTWLRMQLRAYLESEPEVDINGDGFSCLFIDGRHLMDDEVGIPIAELKPETIIEVFPWYIEQLAQREPYPNFARVHEAYVRRADGSPIFPSSAIARAIELVRNPLDVAVSFAYHSGRSMDRMIDFMINGVHTQHTTHSRLQMRFPIATMSWGENVCSWADQTDIPILVLRYEDRLIDPLGTFENIVDFLGLEKDSSRIRQAVEATQFDRLQAQEKRNGFRERYRVEQPFFRRGISGGWRDELTDVQAMRIIDAFAPTMRRFGYLDEAGNPA